MEEIDRLNLHKHICITLQFWRMETVNKFVGEINYKTRISMFSVSAAILPENAEVIKALEYGNACGK